jgi:DNA segregation ATPase FtsK/SpoIIIE, S-DNA-T family
MATAKTKTKKKAPPQRRTAARGGKQGAPRKKATADEQPISEHLRDIWGIVLLVLAALAALGLYADAAGRVGLFLVVVFRTLFGVFGLAAPVGLAAGGLLLLRETKPSNGRVVVGVLLCIAAVAGLWHLGSGAPELGPPSEVLFRSGGWLGAAMALPLRSVAATGGAVVVLVALLALGAMIATATPPRVVVRHVAATGQGVADRFRDWRESRAAEEEDGEEAEETIRVDDDPETVDLGEASARTERVEPVIEGVVDDPEADASDTRLMPQGVDTGAIAGAALQLAPRDETWASYELPPLALLRPGRSAPGNKKTLDQMTRALEHTMQQFGVDAHVARVTRGPAVTRFELSLGEGTRVGAVTKLSDDISYALATPEIRIVAPIPGKSAIGIEVPNRDRDLITLGDVLRSPEAESQRHPLTAGIGVDIAGNPLLVNLATMPHLLIAGATGSGKSVTMNSIVTSVIMRTRPDQVRLILVDPKRVELNHYEGVPHLLTPVVTEPKRAKEALDWAVVEMEQRYEQLALLGYRNIDTYNAAVRDGTVRHAPAISGKADEVWKELPYILLVIDELSDLMMVAPRDVEGAIVRLSQMARAVGIHLIIATQRPEVAVITGLIKANIPSRLALAMTTATDSRTILDQGGAEKLVGHGDLLFRPANASKPHRIQGCYVNETEIEQIVEHCKAQRRAEYVDGVVREGDEAKMADVTSDDATDEDLTLAAKELVVRSGLGSTSMLQRKLKVGFARAGRLMDELEEMGVVGPSEGPKARQVLMSVEELEAGRAGGAPDHDQP